VEGCIDGVFCTDDLDGFTYRSTSCLGSFAYPCGREYACVPAGTAEDGSQYAAGCQHRSGEIGPVTLCHDCGECAETGESIRCCARLPGYIPLDASTGWDAACESWGRWPTWMENASGLRVDCPSGDGCFVPGCELEADSERDLCNVPDAPAGSLSPECAAQIEAVIDAYSGSLTPCLRGCLGLYESCMTERMCADPDYCAGRISSCATICG
jgi:hypothetical protein